MEGLVSFFHDLSEFKKITLSERDYKVDPVLSPEYLAEMGIKKKYQKSTDNQNKCKNYRLRVGKMPVIPLLKNTEHDSFGWLKQKLSLSVLFEISLCELEQLFHYIHTKFLALAHKRKRPTQGRIEL